MRDLLAWGLAAYPMRYQPLSGDQALEKDSYIAPTWTSEQLNMVAMARRVIGAGGAFPPYEGLIKKFLNAHNFDDAFSLYSDRGRASQPKKRKTNGQGFELGEFAWDLNNMGNDHQFPTHSLSSAS